MKIFKTKNTGLFESILMTCDVLCLAITPIAQLLGRDPLVFLVLALLFRSSLIEARVRDIASGVEESR